MEMTKKADVWIPWSKRDKNGQNKKKPGWGNTRLGNVVQRKGTVEGMAESNSSSNAAIIVGTAIQGTKETRMVMAGNYFLVYPWWEAQIKECPKCQKAQALIQDDKKYQRN